MARPIPQAFCSQDGTVCQSAGSQRNDNVLTLRLALPTGSLSHFFQIVTPCLGPPELQQVSQPGASAVSKAWGSSGWPHCGFCSQQKEEQPVTHTAFRLLHWKTWISFRLCRCLYTFESANAWPWLEESNRVIPAAWNSLQNPWKLKELLYFLLFNLIALTWLYLFFIFLLLFDLYLLWPPVLSVLTLETQCFKLLSWSGFPWKIDCVSMEPG